MAKSTTRRCAPRLETLDDRTVPAGQLDPTFGTLGRTFTDFGGTIDVVTDLGLQQDGKIVAVGRAGDVLGLARYSAEGTLDPTFGSGGKLTTDFFTSDSPGFARILVAADGKLVAAGDVFQNNEHDFGLARFNPNGTLDQTFGIAGHVTTDFFGEGDSVFALSALPDGRLVVAGVSATTSSGFRTSLARYNADGSPDVDFGIGGKVAVTFPDGVVNPVDMAVQSDGRILVAGVLSEPSGAARFALARFRPDGSLDDMFGVGGLVTTSFLGGREVAYSLAIQPNGKIVAAGQVENVGLRNDVVGVARYLPDGRLDSTFSFDGKALVGLPAPPGSTRGEQATGVALQPDGKLLVNVYTLLDGVAQFGIARLQPDGSIDRSFGTNGYAITDLGQEAVPIAMILQPDGNIIAAGRASSGVESDNVNFVIVRYLDDGANILVSGSDANVEPRVHVFDAVSGLEKFSFLAYDAAFRGGVRVAAGDVNGDGTADIITAPGIGAERLVKIFDGKTGEQFAAPLDGFLPYTTGFGRGVFVAAGDVTGDGRADILVGTGSGNNSAPRVKVWDPATQTFAYNFLAFGAAFHGGVRVAAGDVNGDGRADIIAATGPGGMPLVRVFDGATGLPLAGRLGRFLAGPVGFRGGLFVSAGDVDGDGLADLVVGVGADRGTEPRITVYYADGKSPTSFLAFDNAFRGGVRVGTADVNGDGREEVVVGAGGGTGMQVRVFDGVSGTGLDDFAADDFDLTHGVFVAGSRAVSRRVTGSSSSVPG